MIPRFLHHIRAKLEKSPWQIYGMYLLLLAIQSYFSIGWLQADEHARVLEPAHKLIYGFATLPWEISGDNPMVSYLLGLIHAPILGLAKCFSLSGQTEAFLLRLFSALVNSSRLIAMAIVIKFYTRVKKAQSWYLIFYAFAPFTMVLLMRTSQENWATTALLWSLACFSLAKPASSEKMQLLLYVLSGFFATLCVSFRLQMGFSIAVLGVFMAGHTYIQSRSKGKVFCLALGALLGLVPLGAVDWFFLETPFKTAWNYFVYALHDEEGGGLWGSESWLFYVKGFLLSWYPPFTIIIAYLIIIGLSQSWVFSAITIPFLLIHLLLSHKELRYFTPLFPIFHLASIIGIEASSSKWRYLKERYFDQYFTAKTVRIFKKALSLYIGFTIFCGLLFALVPLNPSSFLYQKLSDLRQQDDLNEFTYVGNTRSTVSLFYYKYPDHLPQQMELDPFLQKLKSEELLEGDFALYRIPFDTYQNEIVPRCRIDFVSLSAPEVWAYIHFPRLIRVRLIDLIAHCGHQL